MSIPIEENPYQDQDPSGEKKGIQTRKLKLTRREFIILSLLAGCAPVVKALSDPGTNQTSEAAATEKAVKASQTPKPKEKDTTVVVATQVAKATETNIPIMSDYPVSSDNFQLEITATNEQIRKNIEAGNPIGLEAMENFIKGRLWRQENDRLMAINKFVMTPGQTEDFFNKNY